jgi:hypothetical protein
MGPKVFHVEELAKLHELFFGRHYLQSPEHPHRSSHVQFRIKLNAGRRSPGVLVAAALMPMQRLKELLPKEKVFYSVDSSPYCGICM